MECVCVSLGIRGEGDQLYSQASQSPTQYAEFCQAFQQTCPEEPRAYERALFMFGGFIMRIPPKNAPTPIEQIDAALKKQEQALTDMQNTAEYSLVDLTKRDNSVP